MLARGNDGGGTLEAMIIWARKHESDLSRAGGRLYQFTNLTASSLPQLYLLSPTTLGIKQP